MATLADIQNISLRHLRDDRGAIHFLEPLRDVPFAAQNIFFIRDVVAHTTRGEHAHRHTNQLLCCLAGECTVRCHDGVAENIFLLHDSTTGLLIPPMIWSRQHYRDPDTVLLVISDHPFDETDYLRDFETFLRCAREGCAP